jgi:radical SAM superfamily enzyme YgiQ (UPF0313 family)
LFYFDVLPDREAFLKEVREIDPGLMCFSFSSHQWCYIRKLAEWLAESHPIPTVAGGPHPTHAPEEVISHSGISVVCRGEGDEAIVELVDTLDKGQDPSSILNLWVQRGDEIIRNDVRPLVSDLDCLPFSDRTMFNMEIALRDNDYEMSMMAGRGCPLNCHYCCNNPLMKLYRGKGKFVRFRSVNNILHEIDLIAERYKFNILFFQDDLFTLKKEWVEEFCSSYRHSFRFPFSINTRVGMVDRDMLVMLKDAGLSHARVGIESGNEQIRRGVMNRRMSNKQIEDVFKWLHELDIHARAYNMLGVPGDTVETIHDTILLNKRIKPNQVQVSVFHPYPGTKLYETCHSEGYLSGEEQSSFLDGDTVLNLPNLSQETIKELFDEFSNLALSVDQINWATDLERGRKGYYDFMLNLSQEHLVYGDPEMVKTDRFFMNAEPRYVLFEHPRARLKYSNVKLKEGTVLRFGIALSHQCLEWGGHGVRFRIIVKKNDVEREVFNQCIDPKSRIEDRRWHDFEVDLSTFGSNTVDICFLTDPDESGDLTGAWAGWSRPHLWHED